MTSSTNSTAAAAMPSRPESAQLKPLPKWLRNIDQTELTTKLITVWMDADPEAQDAWLARLIAATIHDGPDTALGIFAATGRLYAEEALDELNDVEVPLEREGWVDSLGRYIISRGGRS